MSILDVTRSIFIEGGTGASDKLREFVSKNIGAAEFNMHVETVSLGCGRDLNSYLSSVKKGQF